jgi:hypothetical protein
MVQPVPCIIADISEMGARLHNRITLRLAARIKDLRDRGYEIPTKEREDKNTVYVLVDVPAPKQEAIW